MRPFQWLGRFVKKASSTWPLVIRALFTGGLPIPPPSVMRDYMLLYQTDPWIYASVWIVANTAASIPMRIKRPNGDYLYKHKMLRVLTNPNPRMSKHDFFEASFAFLELTGNCYWEKVKNQLGTTSEIYTMRPDRVKIVPGDDRRLVKGYQYFMSNSAEFISFDADDIVHFVYFNPLDDWHGMTPLRPLATSIVADKQGQSWLERYLKKYGVKEGHLTTEQPVSEAESKRLSVKWRGRYQQDQTALLPRGLEYKAMGDSPKDGGMFEVDSMTRQKKLATIGVPPVKVGLVENAKYASYDLQSRAFILDTIKHKLEKVAGGINRGLLPSYPTLRGCIFEFDTSKIVFTDILAFIESIVKLFDRDALTINELIEITEFGKPYKGGGKRYSDVRAKILEASTRARVDRLGMQDSPGPKTDSPGKDKPTQVGKAATGQGAGVGGQVQQTGGTDVCTCPKCGAKVKHERGVPCTKIKCPKCGSAMTGIT